MPQLDIKQHIDPPHYINHGNYCDDVCRDQQPPSCANENCNNGNYFSEQQPKNEQDSDRGSDNIPKMVRYKKLNKLKSINRPIKQPDNPSCDSFFAVHHYVIAFMITISILFINIYAGFNPTVFIAAYIATYLITHKIKPAMRLATLNILSPCILILSICFLILNRNIAVDYAWSKGFVNSIAPVLLGVIDRIHIKLLPNISARKAGLIFLKGAFGKRSHINIAGEK